MSRLARILLLAAVALCVVVPPAGATPVKKLTGNLAAMWTTLLETPSAQNPFGSGGAAFTCIDLGRTIAPFGPVGAEWCTVKPGTPIFVAASSFECSTFEEQGTTDAELRACAREVDVSVAPAVTVDGRRVRVTEVETRLLRIVLQAGNLFELPAGTRGLSVAHGWVTLLHPLRPGTHTIVISGIVDREPITTTIR